MEPIYFNPLDSSGNYIGTNPLTPNSVPIKTSYAKIFNPSLYQSYNFFSFPNTFLPETILQTTLLGSNDVVNFPQISGPGSTLVGSFVDGAYAFLTYQYYETVEYFSSQFSTFQSNYASYYQIDPVSYSIRFGTELQALYARTDGATDTIATYENIFSQQYYFYSNVVYTVHAVDPPTPDGSIVFPTGSSVLSSGLFSTALNTILTPLPSGSYVIGSSSFVNMLGSNVYTALLDTTNSVIVYQNEQISTYYSQSLSYQVNITNLTAALNSVSGGSPANTGNGTIPVTVFSWIWESTTGGWTGSQVTNFDGYVFSTVVNSYLYFTYGGTTISNSSVAVTQVQSIITVQNNYLSNAQTFLNNAVTTLQSQVSLAGQIISSLASGMETVINNM